ncbi:hypothetical protein [Nitratidesulfovibrio sp.]|uniref:phenylacetate--CoA ligase family protein n=1 Tax=Nitratidesulfovibrio sp. TaxID=2802297 RepID=UPI00333ECE17
MIGYARMLLHRVRGNQRDARMREHLALQWLPMDELRQRQFWRLAALVRHAYVTVPRYRALLDDMGMRPEDIRSFADFATLPELPRDIVLTRPSDLAATALSGGPPIGSECLSAGGNAMRFCQDTSAREEMYANWSLCLSFAGWRTSDMVVRLHPSPSPGRGKTPHGVRQWLSGCMTVDAGSYGKDEIAGWLRGIRRYGRVYVHGGVSVLVDMAEHALATGARMPDVRGIIATGGRLHEGQRALITQAFGCRVQQLYGTDEVPCIAVECEFGNMHMLTHSTYVEFVPDQSDRPDRSDWPDVPDRPDQAGAPGVTDAPGVSPRLLVTDLDNRAMPLLRYDTGDHAIAVDGACPCGRGFPLMRLDTGDTWFVKADGRRLSRAGMERRLARLKGVRALRLVQTVTGRVDMYVVRGVGFDADADARLRASCRYVEGNIVPGLAVVLHYVDAPREGQLPGNAGGGADCAVPGGAS